MENTIRSSSMELQKSMWLLAGLLIGGLVGFGSVILLAPQSGKKTRFQIKRKSIEFQERVTETFDDLVALSYYDNRIILLGASESTNIGWF